MMLSSKFLASCVLMLSIMLTMGCEAVGFGSTPTPTPNTIASRVAEELSIAATLTARAPTKTSTPTATLTPTFTPTATPSRTPTFTPTPTATNTSSPTATELPEPKAGHWIGEPEVAFDVKTSNVLSDFKMVIPFIVSCSFSVSSVVLDADNSFVLSQDFTANDGTVYIQRIKGQLESGTKFSGTYEIGFCSETEGRALVSTIGNTRGEWSAEWSSAD